LRADAHPQVTPARDRLTSLVIVVTKRDDTVVAVSTSRGPTPAIPKSATPVTVPIVWRVASLSGAVFRLSTPLPQPRRAQEFAAPRATHHSRGTPVALRGPVARSCSTAGRWL